MQWCNWLFPLPAMLKLPVCPKLHCPKYSIFTQKKTINVQLDNVDNVITRAAKQVQKHILHK